MAAKLLIAASTDAEMRYATGLAITDQFILLDTGAKRYVLVSSLEYGRAKRALRGKRGFEVVLFDKHYDAIKKARQRKGAKVRKGSVLALIAAAYLKERRIEAVVMPRTALAIHVEQLKCAGITVGLARLYDRSVKTKEEIEEMKKVRDAAVVAMQRCIAIIKGSKIGNKKELVHKGEKVTSEYLRAEARKLLVERECESPEMIISHGTQSAYPHEEGKGAIKAGEPIVMDFFPRSMTTGYWFDMTRTVCKGKPSDALRKQWDAVKEAQDAGLKKVRAGVRTGTIHRAVLDVFARRGYKTTTEEGYIHSTGHGVGLEIHEAPSIHDKGTEVLKAGMVITIEPGLYYRAVGGVRLENTVLVTTTGYKDLTRTERVLQL